MGHCGQDWDFLPVLPAEWLAQRGACAVGWAGPWSAA